MKISKIILSIIASFLIISGLKNVLFAGSEREPGFYNAPSMTTGIFYLVLGLGYFAYLIINKYRNK
jgi:hypothetical protein